MCPCVARGAQCKTLLPDDFLVQTSIKCFGQIVCNKSQIQTTALVSSHTYEISSLVSTFLKLNVWNILKLLNFQMLIKFIICFI